MDIYFSDFFGVDEAQLEDYGAFNVSLVNDLPLFIDPFLLFNSTNEVYQGLHNDIIDYMRFLKNVSLKRDIPDELLIAWFTFPEVKQNWFGFSQTGNDGRGLGIDFARALNRNFQSLFTDFGEESVSRGSHLEKFCLVRAGVGRDNLSDFTTNLIKKYLIEYTQQFAAENISPDLTRKVSVNKVEFNYETGSWVSRLYILPYYENDYVLLTPKNILTKDETWINRPDLVHRLPEIANALPNGPLRAQVNEYLFRVLPKDPKPKKRDFDEAYNRTIDKFPQILDYYIRKKEDEGDRATFSASSKVKSVELYFVKQVSEFVERLLRPTGFYSIPAITTYDEAKMRLEYLKDVIENKGGHRLFYINNQPIQRESDLQILYRLTWFATNTDVSQEVNDGRGPADYKISVGAKDKTIVEFKLAKNPQLKRNLEKQAEIYEKASDATNPSLKVILYFDDTQFQKVQGILRDLELTDSPHIILIDASRDNKPSASKA